MSFDAASLRHALGCSAALAERFAGPLAAACAFYGIDTPRRQAHFLAQVGHESGGLRWTTEIWGPTPAQRRYEGRADLGNTQPGDGERFRGHGLIQTTGRHNHARVRDRLRERFPLLRVPDFEAAPERLAEPQWAALSAADYWDDRGCNTLADVDDLLGITRRVNGGYNGLDDRRRRLARATEALGAARDAPPLPTPRPARENAATAAPAVPLPAPGPTMLSQPTEEVTMPIPAIIPALLPSLVQLLPQLGKLFGAAGSEVAERNVKAAQLVADTVVQATGARNLQEAVETMQASPAALAAASGAIEQRWYELGEVGGGIEAARQADRAATSGDGPWWAVFRSPSLIVALLLLPLVYLLVLSLIGVVGSATWSDDVRAGLAGSVISAIVGGLIGYYYGQTTSRNRGPAPQA